MALKKGFILEKLKLKEDDELVAIIELEPKETLYERVRQAISDYEDFTDVKIVNDVEWFMATNDTTFLIVQIEDEKLEFSLYKRDTY